MGCEEGGSGGASNGGGNCWAGGNSGTGGTGAGFSSASSNGYRAAKKYIEYAGKKTVAGTHTRAIK
jgi:ABC-type glycerol-3-phosphate transport system substrate-binding protein